MTISMGVHKAIFTHFEEISNSPEELEANLAKANEILKQDKISLEDLDFLGIPEYGIYCPLTKEWQFKAQCPPCEMCP